MTYSITNANRANVFLCRMVARAGKHKRHKRLSLLYFFIKINLSSSAILRDKTVAYSLFKLIVPTRIQAEFKAVNFEAFGKGFSRRLMNSA